MDLFRPSRRPALAFAAPCLTLNQRNLRGQTAMTLVEMAIGLAVLGLVVATSLTCLTILNKNALSSRVIGNAREVVQTEIEQAVGAPFTSSSIPPNLVVGTTTQTPTIYTSRDGTGLALTGTLTREVTSITDTVRQLKVRLDYTLYGKKLTYEATTMRAMDK